MSVLHPDWRWLKELLIRWLWLTQAQGREGYGMRDEPVVAEAGVSVKQPLACLVFSQEVVPGSRDPGSGRLHRIPGGEVWIVTCACTQDSWWLQQQR